ncbi:hypothetical protein [Synechococcus sp. CB0101]|uniref:hypothetical protein n=1 Tax=Synechococcus sp. CB0101 TaxID=232348 RepID=UPI0002002012|nr:hypothetical protein [Synechococcus sp. CB0101]
MSPAIIILAGPNGAGKTTFARSFLPQEANCLRFINADLIAAGLPPYEVWTIWLAFASGAPWATRSVSTFWHYRVQKQPSCALLRA